MTTATLNGQTILSMELVMPYSGIWWLDCEVDSAETMTGSAAVVVAGLSLTGTIMTGATWQSKTRYRVAAGAGQWGETVEARQYQNDAGIRISKIVGDAASAVGEAFVASDQDGMIGSAYARERGPASRCLSLLAPRRWYVDNDGTTRLGARAMAEYDGELTVIDRDDASGRLVVAVPDISTVVPAAVIDGVAAVDVVHSIVDNALRTTIYSDARGSSTRIVGAIERIVSALLASERYRGVWSYRIVAQSGERLDLQAERSASAMPDLLRVRVMPGMAGLRADHKLGAICLVAFVNADPARPVVVGFDDADSAGFAPSKIDAGNDAPEAVAIASLVESDLGDIATAVKNAATVPNDGGAALKTAIIAALTASGWASGDTPPTVASSNLRAEP